MRALTLWRPWSDAVVNGPKRIENRPWRPWPSVVGTPTLIAVHAGKKYDTDTRGWDIAGWPGGYEPPGDEDCPTGVVGVARVVGYMDTRVMPVRREGPVDDLDRDPWWVGPVGWLLADVQALPEPVPCRGALGLWWLPDDVESAVLGQLGASASSVLRSARERGRR